MKAVAEWEVVPSTPEQIAAVVAECRRMVSRRALLAAGVAVVPIPGLDWATNVGVLLKVLPDINRKFGLSAEQVERLSPDRRLVVFKAITAGGTMLVGRLVTRELVMSMLRMVGVRLSAQQAVKYVPIAGQGLSAVLTYGALRYVCDQHIKQCMAVCEQLRLPAPSPVAGG
ncbi:MAG: hypothetical protein ACRC4O_08815 [Giesbergeria sp.]